jgi:hypothetical protein
MQEVLGTALHCTAPELLLLQQQAPQGQQQGQAAAAPAAAAAVSSSPQHSCFVQHQQSGAD